MKSFSYEGVMPILSASPESVGDVREREEVISSKKTHYYGKANWSRGGDRYV
ncbi:MAG: hypothetical protein L6264_05120 [Weeksellaceae bacterium]|nr:hypothetical protein [Bacteroidota bacterium]MCG2780310.1 hypothetical protein [Weeksellaceae bacterium]